MVTVTVHPWMNCHVTLKQYEALAKERPEMYAAFAPELDTVYARLYAAARLGAELSARKNVLAVTLQNEGYAMEDRRGFRNLF